MRPYRLCRLPSRVNWCPAFTQGIPDAFVTPTLTHRLGDGWNEHTVIEVWTHALNDLAVEERISLGFATQLMPFLHGWSLVGFLLPLVAFLRTSGLLMLASHTSPTTARDNLGEP